MNIKFFHITRSLALAVLLHLLLALAPAMAQTVVYVGETSTLSVEPNSGDNYMWTLYNDSTVNFAVDPGTVSATYFEFVGNSNSSTVTILWHEPGVYFFRINVTDITGCTNNLRVGKVKVIPAIAKILPPAPICAGETCTLTVELSGYKDSEWEYTVEFAPVSGSTATRTVIGTAKAPPGEYKVTDLLQIPAPNLVESTIFQVISVTNKLPSGKVVVTTIPSKPVTLVVYPPPKSSDIYKKN